MSKDQLHAIAQMDTPEAVQVPNTWAGLIAWGFTRFGTTVMVLIICLAFGGAAVNRMYDDNARTGALVLELVRSQASANARLEATLSELAKQVENNTRAVTDLQRSTTRN